MKKYATFLMLAAATSLSACAHHGDYYNGNYQGENQYENGDHAGWGEARDARLDTMVDELFRKADTNHDGYISLKEYEAYARRTFREVDTNHDGKLSRQEVLAYKREKMRKTHREMSMNRDDRNETYTTSYNNTDTVGSGTRSYRDEASYQDMTPAAGEDMGTNNNAYSNNGANVARYNETH